MWSIVLSQGFQIKKLYSSNVAFENRLESLQDWFQNRGYAKTLVDNQLKHVTETRETSDDIYKVDNDVPLVLPGHHQLKYVNDSIKKTLVFLYAKEQVDNIFTPPPFASFHTDFNLRKHFVRVKVYPCQTCLTLKTFFRVLL